MNCPDARNRIVATDRGDALAAHVASCPECARFDARMRVATSALRGHHAGVEPDAGFAARVVRTLPDTNTDAFGWAALRLMPAAVALALALSGWCVLTTPAPDAWLEESPTEAPLAWLMETAEEAE